MALTKVNATNIIDGILPVANGGTGSTSLSGANLAVTNATNTFTVDQSISGLTVGKGLGSQSSNTAVGNGALGSNTSGNTNSAFGFYSLISNTTGSSNSSYGYTAMQNNTTGANNVAYGHSALFSNTTASNNTAVGFQALYNNTTASENVAVGYQAGYSNTTSAVNTFVGNKAGYNSNYTSGAAGNTLIGASAGYGITTGYGNTIVSSNGPNNSNPGGFYITTGNNNSIFGAYNGNQGGLDIRTSSNYVVLSDGSGNIVFRASQAGTTSIAPQITASNNAYGFDTSEFYPNPDNTMKLGISNFRWTTVYATTGTINTSDATQKQQIRDLNETEKAVATRIKGLIKAFKWNDAVEAKGDGARIHIGVIAQEVQSAFKAEGLDPAKYAMFCSDTWYEVDGKSAEPANPYTKDTPNAVEITRLGVRYEQLLAFVISAL
jgi:hypothetical protein